MDRDETAGGGNFPTRGTTGVDEATVGTVRDNNMDTPIPHFHLPKWKKTASVGRLDGLADATRLVSSPLVTSPHVSSSVAESENVCVRAHG